MDALNASLLQPTLPYALKGLIEQIFIAVCIDLVDERDVRSGLKDERELHICGCEHVVDAIVGAIDDLDVFHKY